MYHIYFVQNVAYFFLIHLAYKQATFKNNYLFKGFEKFTDNSYVFFQHYCCLNITEEEEEFFYLSHTQLYNQQWNVLTAFNPSKCTHTWSSGQSGEQLGVQCLAQGSHLSRGQFLPEPRFEPTTSGYKSNALSTRATTVRLPLEDIIDSGSFNRLHSH